MTERGKQRDVERARGPNQRDSEKARKLNHAIQADREA